MTWSGGSNDDSWTDDRLAWCPDSASRGGPVRIWPWYNTYCHGSGRRFVGSWHPHGNTGCHSDSLCTPHGNQPAPPHSKCPPPTPTPKPVTHTPYQPPNHGAGLACDGAGDEFDPDPLAAQGQWITAAAGDALEGGQPCTATGAWLAADP